MKRNRHMEEQIMAILKEHEAGMKTADLCRKHGISEASFYNWKAKYRTGMICSSICLLRFIVWSSLQGQTPVHPGSAQGGNVTASERSGLAMHSWPYLFGGLPKAHRAF